VNHIHVKLLSRIPTAKAEKTSGANTSSDDESEEDIPFTPSEDLQQIRDNDTTV
jgi:hypothetical protein